jgi:hypothetical protein
MTTTTRLPPVLSLQQALKAVAVSPPYGGIPASRLQPVAKPPWYDLIPAQGKALIEDVRQGRMPSIVLVWNGCLLALNHYPHGPADADGKRKGFVARLLKVAPGADTPSPAIATQAPVVEPQPPAAPRSAAPDKPTRPRRVLSWLVMAAAAILFVGALLLVSCHQIPLMGELPGTGLKSRVTDLEGRLDRLEQKLQDDPGQK